MNQQMISAVKLAECTERHLTHAFMGPGALILQGECSPRTTRKVYNEARIAFVERKHLESQPYDVATQTGYIPPGAERTVRSRALYLRHAFDYRPKYVTFTKNGTEDGALRAYYANLVLTARRVIALLNRVTVCPLTPLIAGSPYVLRIAEALNAVSEPYTEIFPTNRDYGLFTVFGGPTEPGLQMLINSRWASVSLGAGEYLIAPGMLFRQYYPAACVAPHRVMGTWPRRISLTLFVDPRRNVVLPSGELAAEYFEHMRAKTYQAVA